MATDNKHLHIASSEEGKALCGVQSDRLIHKPSENNKTTCESCLFYEVIALSNEHKFDDVVHLLQTSQAVYIG
jgi:hypothetical protein